MENDKKDKLGLDILAHIEKLSSQVNEIMAVRTKSVLRRYPITFALLILAGIITVSEGLKGVLKEIGLLNLNPWFVLILGLVILAVTGKLYQKLDK